MEAFSLLKYWRGGGGGGGGGGVADAVSVRASGANVRAGAAGTTTIVTAVSNQVVETDDEEDDDGPFFDLEFAVPDEEEEGEGEGEEGVEKSRGNVEEGEEEEDDDVESTGTEGEREFKFTLSSSGSSGDRTDPNLSLSPSDDLFFKGRLVPIEPSSLVFNSSEPNSKGNQFPVSLLKSATKFRVFMLGLKKSKSSTVEKTESNGSASATPKPDKQESQGQPQPQPESQPQSQSQPQPEQQKQQESKFFTVKFKVEEVPIMSLFTRDNSSRSSTGTTKAQKQNSDETASDEKRFSKDVMQKYLKMVKPLYVRVSRRYGEKLRFSGQLSLGSGAKPGPATAPAANQKTSPTKSKTEPDQDVTETPAINAKSQKQGNIPAGLRVVCKHLGKSRSASSAVAAVPSAPCQSRRRDDSLLQQQDGIQSAILHCKRSFNASRGISHHSASHLKFNIH